jgi:hypothetical protein
MSKSTKKPPKWYEVYPKGTVEGDEEHAFFTSLARHPKYDWRSIAQIVKDTGLTRKRVEEIIAKYYVKGMVFQSPKNDELWAYFERCPELLEKDDGTVVQQDQQKRMDNFSPSMICFSKTGRNGEMATSQNRTMDAEKLRIDKLRRDATIKSNLVKIAREYCEWRELPREEINEQGLLLKFDPEQIKEIKIDDSRRVFDLEQVKTNPTLQDSINYGCRSYGHLYFV